jgi:hypothetical protein
VLSKLHEVVDLAVEYDPATAVRRRHRLPTQFGEIEDRETPVHESDAARMIGHVTTAGAHLVISIEQPSIVIGSTVFQSLTEDVQQRCMVRGLSGNDSGYSAHS